MLNDIDANFINDIEPSDSGDRDNVAGIDESRSLANKKAEEQAQKNLLARKRIDELRENKRLKDQLDDSEDW
jgi:hypothetical protein